MADERTSEFSAVFTQIISGLQQVLGVSGDIFVFTSSTTGAFESAVQNIFCQGEKVLVVNSGAFGARWVAMCQAYGLQVVELSVEQGKEADPTAVEEALAADPDIAAAIAVHCETSTGVVADLKEFGMATRKVLSIVDSASGVGGCELHADEWGLDVVIGGTQKALMTPPGISFVSVSDRAWHRHTRATLPRYYFDWTISRESLAHPIPRTPWTPAVGVLLQLATALEMVLAEGMAPRVERHMALGRIARSGLNGLGLRLLTPNLDRNGIVTAAFTPEGVGAIALVQAVADHTGVQLTTGIGEMADHVFRIGHCGYVDSFDVITALAAIEIVLSGLGSHVEPGSGVVPALRLVAQEARSAFEGGSARSSLIPEDTVT
jgi:aspartate aminotransferase-like enzyme